MSEILEIIEMLIQEVEKHNDSYHYVTPASKIEKAKEIYEQHTNK